MKHKKLRWLTALALIAALALPCALAMPIDPSFGIGTGAAGADAPEPTPEPDETADIELAGEKDDGVIRVYLKSLAGNTSLSLRLDGLYTVERDAGFRFAQGSEILVSAANGKLYLTSGGLTLDMGAAFTLTRQACEGENGLVIAETGRETLYPGDLSLSVDEAGGVRAVLAANMEDYLCGVVAYEMSDSWPLEALKAQAVAARTYALKKKTASAARDYDVVDTTGDQVFKGVDAAYANVARAVRATRGVVGTWNGGYADCFYTASNGGVVALPSDVWDGSGDYGYLEHKTDPYDLANPNSMVSSVSFDFDAANCPALKDMLSQALRAAAPEYEDIELEEIVSITPADETPEGSGMYRTLNFELSASAMVERYQPGDNDAGAPRDMGENAHANLALYTIDYLRRMALESPYQLEKARETLDETFTVSLSVYEQIKDGLNLGLNAADYELVSVRTDLTDFTIELRRFGHGVGMSQRGAQRMAGVEGKAWQEILAFYYPGMALKKLEWDTPALEEIEALPEGVGAARPDPTPAPTPAPLPELVGGQYYATVRLGDASSTMNVRQSPTTQSPAVAQVENGRRLIVCSEPDADGWVSVMTAEFSGYAKLEYLEKE